MQDEDQSVIIEQQDLIRVFVNKRNKITVLSTDGYEEQIVEFSAEHASAIISAITECAESLKADGEKATE